MARKRIDELDKNLQAEASTAAGLRWVSASDPQFTMRGLPWWSSNGGRFSRLPLHAEQLVRDQVWQLAQCPASAYLDFRSDTSDLAVRVTNSDTYVMPHMPATGSNGLILYTRIAGQFHPWRTVVPDQEQATFERDLFRDQPACLREFRLYLPLYKSLTALDLGLSPDAQILPPAPSLLDKPIVFYGTSITQGGCASTAGADFVSTVGRLLNLDVVNLGFSGNGRGEPELARLIAEIDAALYVLDYVANTDVDGLRKTLPRFISILRTAHPQTPILLQGPLCYGGQWSAQQVVEQRAVMMEAYLRCRKRGDQQIHFVDGFSLIPFGTDAAYVDGVHPTDHGFRLMAERLAPMIAQILFQGL
ncbi:MAG: SGNH/GDSL hydrolase family protein [Armatimonadota bacterium]